MEYSPCPHGIFSSRVCEICEALAPVQKQLELYAAEMSEAKEELEMMHNYHDKAMIAIGKTLGVDLEDEPRFKWVDLAASNLVRELELYAAEMAGAKAAGFETAQDLLTSYKALLMQHLLLQALVAEQAEQILEQQARIEELVNQLGYEAQQLSPKYNMEALTNHVNAEKVKMLEDVEKRLTAYEQHTAASQVSWMIAELTKDKQ